MDDVYATELLQQSLIDACEREKGLNLKLQAAQDEMEELKRRAFVHKRRFQELDEALEIEEAKTNAERLARQEAEETARQHGVEVLTARKNETIAKEHCDAAESEILRLQSDLSMERSTTAGMDLQLCHFREDLGQSEYNGMVAYENLQAAKAKVCALQDDLGVALDRISMLERQARESEAAFKKEHWRVEEAEQASCAIADELKSNKSEPSNTLEKYNDPQAQHIERDSVESAATTASDTDRLNVDSQSNVELESVDSRSSEYERVPVSKTDKSMEETMSTAENRKINPLDMPALPEPARLRPALASVTVCQVEIFKTTGRILPAPRVNLRSPPWRCFWRFRSNSLHLLFRSHGRD